MVHAAHDSCGSHKASNRLETQISELKAALDEGMLREAEKRHREVHQARLCDPLKETFRTLSQRLHELQDWQAFVTTPKRHALFERMISLGQSSLALEQKARKIKRMHKEWQSLGASNSKEAQRLWARFKAASDAAYAPCAAHFAARDKEREANRREKEAICEELERFVATMVATPVATIDAGGSTRPTWESTDFRQVASMLHRSHTAWRQLTDIPRRSIRPLNKRFFAAIRPIQEQLEQEQTRNHERKRQIIDALKLRLDQEQDSQVLIGYARRLQQDWKQIGVTDRATDQKLWKSFRSACDAAFARHKHDQLKAAQDAANRAQQRQARIDEHKREYQRKVKICHMLEEGKLDPGAAESTWISDISLPPDLEADLLARREASQQPSTPAVRERAERLCVEAEMLTGIERQEGESLRMELRLERLRQGLGQGIRDQRSDAEQLRSAIEDFHRLPLGRGHGCLKERLQAVEDQFMQQAER